MWLVPLALALAVLVPAEAMSDGTEGARTGSVLLAADSTRLVRDAHDAVRDRMDGSWSHAGVLARLDEIGEAIPGDDWVLRHRIGTRLLMQRFEEADDVLDACAPDRWWCHAMAVLRWSLVGDWVRAGAAARRLELHQPPGEQCRWLDDAWPLLSPAAAATWRELDCEGRRQQVEVLWWLADPAHLLGENPRYLEHVARLAAMALHHDELALLDFTCSPSHHEEVLLEGWERYSGFWRRPEAPAPRGRPSPRSWIPEPAALDDPTGARSDHWRAHRTPRRGAPRARLAGVGPVMPLSGHQLVVLPRGDEFEVHAAFSMPGAEGRQDSASGAPPPRAGIVLAAQPGRGVEAALDPAPPPGEPVRVAARVPAEPQLASLEALPGGGRIVRDRFALPLPASDGRLQLSGVVLFDWEPDLPGTADTVLPRMLPEPVLASGDSRVGFFWEVHGLRPGESVEVTLVMEPAGRGRFRRLAEALRLAEGPGSLDLSWTDARSDEPGDGPMARTLRPELRGVAPGTWGLELEVATADGLRVRSRQTVEVVDVP